mmetsp:Transcript_24956/g.68801  ORF Transcript_24956/g.68801 Transcript_24956/m.68801 type:complete len:104 (+) Transcript_24956:391-702(+)
MEFPDHEDYRRDTSDSEADFWRTEGGYVKWWDKVKKRKKRKRNKIREDGRDGSCLAKVPSRFCCDDSVEVCILGIPTRSRDCPDGRNEKCQRIQISFKNSLVA